MRVPPTRRATTSPAVPYLPALGRGSWGRFLMDGHPVGQGSQSDRRNLAAVERRLTRGLVRRSLERACPPGYHLLTAPMGSQCSHWGRKVVDSGGRQRTKSPRNRRFAGRWSLADETKTVDLGVGGRIP